MHCDLDLFAMMKMKHNNKLSKLEKVNIEEKGQTEVSKFWKIKIFNEYNL